MQVLWKTGKGTRKYQVGDNKFQKELTQKLAFDSSEVELERIQRDMVRVRKAIVAVTDKEIGKIFPFIAQSMIGRSAGGRHQSLEITARSMSSNDIPANRSSFSVKGLKGILSQDRRPRGAVYWEPLSDRTIKKKKGNRDFFRHRGHLRRFFQTNAAKLVAGVGTTRVDMEAPVKDDYGKMLRPGRLVIHLAPKVYPTMLPSMRTGDWASFDPKLPLENRLGFSPSVLKKLYGVKTPSKHIHRPLLQPVLGFWLQHRIPSMIAQKIVDVSTGSRGRAS